jgi:3-deoxy-D-manno-octulosonic-acid transferase
MLKLFYNAALFLLGVLALPKLFQAKQRATLKDRLGCNLPKPPKGGDPVIWIHAVSVGETRAVLPLFEKLRVQYPDATLYVSNTTETGRKEASRIMPTASAHFLLPFDFSWIMQKLVKRLKPDLFILVESDFWLNLLNAVKKEGGKTLLVNGKLSERSFHRYQVLKPFAKRLFAPFDHLCIQNEEYLSRFLKLGIDPKKCTVTGNIKFDAIPKRMSSEELLKEKERMGIISTDRVLVIGSTHPKEEERLLDTLKPVWEQVPELKVLLVPRHPERFQTVAEILRSKGIAFGQYTSQADQNERVILVDAMGILMRCYEMAELAIVGGSFVEGIGGHNIFEPVSLGVPVFFGPYMHTQKDLVEFVLTNQAGEQVTLAQLPQAVLRVLDKRGASTNMTRIGYHRHGMAMARSLDCIIILLSSHYPHHYKH